jgi:hypothetical protein
MKKRSVVLIAFLSFITFGAYTPIWLYFSQKEFKQMGYALPSYWRGSAPVLMVAGGIIVQIIYDLVTPKDFPFNMTGVGGIAIPTGFEAVGIILAIIVGLPLALPWLYKYCQAVEHYTAGKYPASLAFTMAIILPFANFGYLWPAILQFEFNNLLKKQPSASPSPQPQFPSVPQPRTPQPPTISSTPS